LARDSAKNIVIETTAMIFPVPELGFFIKNRFFGFFAFAHFHLLVCLDCRQAVDRQIFEITA